MESHVSSSREQIHSFGKCSLGSMMPTELVLLSAQEEQVACQAVKLPEGGKKPPAQLGSGLVQCPSDSVTSVEAQARPLRTQGLTYKFILIPEYISSACTDRT